MNKSLFARRHEWSSPAPKKIVFACASVDTRMPSINNKNKNDLNSVLPSINSIAKRERRTLYNNTHTHARTHSPPPPRTPHTHQQNKVSPDGCNKCDCGTGRRSRKNLRQRSRSRKSVPALSPVFKKKNWKPGSWIDLAHEQFLAAFIIFCLGASPAQCRLCGVAIRILLKATSRYSLSELKRS